MEGRYDVTQCHAAPCHQTMNGMHHRNTHLDFSLDGNDPCLGYAMVRGAYSLVGNIAHSLS